MSTAEKTETKPEHKSEVGGYPLPWRITEPTENGMQEIVDADGDSVIGAIENDDLYAALVPHVNRVAVLESALIEVAGLFDDGSCNDWEGYAEARAIMERVGLADRLPRFMPEASS